MSARPDRTTFLRRSLQLDGVASGLCGVLLLAAGTPSPRWRSTPSGGSGARW